MEAEDEQQAIEMARREIEMLLPDKDSLKGITQLKKDQTRIKNNLDGQIVRILQSKVDEADGPASEAASGSATVYNMAKDDAAEEESPGTATNVALWKWREARGFNEAEEEPRTKIGRALWARSLHEGRPASDTRESCLLYTSPSPRDMRRSRMPSSA